MARRITILSLLLVGLGLAMISSAGIFESQKDFGSNYYYFFHQFYYGLLPGLAAFLICSRINFKFWQKISLPLLIVSVGLLIMVFLPQFGLTAKGATRWLKFGIISFQPSEIFKFAFVIYLAAWLNMREKLIRIDSLKLTPLIFTLFLVGVILVSQPDLGTAVVIGVIAGAMFFISGMSLRYLIVFGVIAAVAVLGLSVISPYRLDRLLSFLNPIDPQGSSYQLNQGLVALGSGGIFGLGFGNSVQKLGALPEPVTDSIFAILGEEMGLVGMFMVLGLFIFLIFSMLLVAKNCRDKFGSFLVFGVASWITIQILINLGAIFGLLPFTGITLPFISYGGTSLVSLLAAMGIVVNVAKRA